MGVSSTPHTAASILPWQDAVLAWDSECALNRQSGSTSGRSIYVGVNWRITTYGKYTAARNTTEMK